MDANRIENVLNLVQALDQSPAKRVCVHHARSCDVSQALLALASNAIAKGKHIAIVHTGEAFLLQRCLAAFSTVPADCLMSIDQLCLDMLCANQDALSRKPRILDANEMDVLVEDMKVTGLKQQRLREMLKFFYRSIAEYDTEEDGWIVTAEEDMVYRTLQANLDIRQAYLPYEAANAAYGALAETPCYDVVYVSGFEALSKSQQRLVAALAGEQLVAFGCDGAVATDTQDYPYPEGFEALCQMPDTACFTYTPAAMAVREQLRCAASPLAEFADVASCVADYIGKGVAAHDIAIAVPNKVWATHIAAALAERGIAYTILAPQRKVSGDPRVAESCASLRAVTALKLIARPQDEVALRSWLGLGDWLMNSSSFNELIAYTQAQSLSLLDALDKVREAEGASDVPFAGAHKFYEPLRALDSLIEACGGKTGQDMLDVLAQHDLAVPEWVQDVADPTDNAAALLNKALAGVNRSEGCVALAPYRSCASLPVEVMFMTGMVNGYLPALDALSDGKTIDYRARILSHEQNLFNQLCSCAIARVVFSYFERDRFENADALHMQVDRIVMKDDVRYAVLTPSQFLQSRIGKE